MINIKDGLKAFQVLTSSNLFGKIVKISSGEILSRVIGLGTTILVIRGLSVNDYAAYAAFYSIVMLAPGLIGSGINRGLVRFSTEYISLTGSKPLELYFVSFIFQLLLYCIFCIVLFFFIGEVNTLLFGQNDFESSLRYGLIAGLGYLLIEAGRGVFQAEERFGIYIKALWYRQGLVFGIIAILFLLNKLDFERSAQAIIFVQLFVASIITFYVYCDVRISRIVRFFKEQSALIKDFIFSTKWLIAYIFVLLSFQRLDLFMLSHYSTVEELASFGIAFRYFALILLLRGSIQAVLLPKFSKVDMHDVDMQRRFTIKWMKVTVWLILPIAVVDIFGKPLFVLINGMQYEKAFYIFIVFTAGIWISLMFSPLVNVLMARKSYKFLFALSVGALVLNFTGNYFIIPKWGGIGAAMITVLSHGMINIASVMRIFLSSK